MILLPIFHSLFTCHVASVLRFLSLFFYSSVVLSSVFVFSSVFHFFPVMEIWKTYRKLCKLDVEYDFVVNQIADKERWVLCPCVCCLLFNSPYWLCLIATHILNSDINSYIQFDNNYEKDNLFSHIQKKIFSSMLQFLCLIK